MQESKIAIIARIEEIAETVPGWTPADQLFALFILAFSAGIDRGDIIEIGSWCGRSTAVLGLAARITGCTRVHCIDLFPSKTDWYANQDGTYSYIVKINDCVYHGHKEQTVWSEPYDRDIATIYSNCDSVREIFDNTISGHGLTDLITVHVGSSSSFLDVAPQGLRCKLAFIDGDHGYNAVCRDIDAVERFLISGGWICFDDAYCGNLGVDQAINERILDNDGYELAHQFTRKMFVSRRK